MKKCLVLIAVITSFCIHQVQAADSFSVLRVSSPMIFSGSLGLRLGEDMGQMRPTIQVEAGVGGGRIAVGLDSTGQSGLGYGIKAAILRTWLAPIGVDEDQNFLGIEAELSIKQLLLSLGGYSLVGDGDDDWLVSTGIGIVF
ncbi:MAG: hypothetical protein EOM20_17620 [Spartobacteria bacterium]|nr:hypothetical protein [Spartobacteria bacterium]